MIWKKITLTFFFIVLFCFASTSFVFACMCGDESTVLSQFESSTYVFIGEIVSLERGDKDFYRDGIKGVKIIVHKVHKGNLKINEEIFINTRNASCDYIFGDSDVGSYLLIYSLAKSSDSWVMYSCSRTTSLELAGDDLLYLDNLEKVKGKSRISGTLHYWGSGENKPSAENHIIKITNFKTKKTYKVKTNKDGVYEIYGLPAGWYYVETEPAKGWKSDNRYRRYLPYDYQAYEKLNEKDYPQDPRYKEGWAKPDAVYLFSNRHAGIDFNFVKN